MKTDMRNKNGDLSLYAFACGYIQRAGDFSGGCYADLFLDGVWHLQYKEGSNQPRIWNCYDSLTEARKAWRKAKKQIQEKANAY